MMGMASRNSDVTIGPSSNRGSKARRGAGMATASNGTGRNSLLQRRSHISSQCVPGFEVSRYLAKMAISAGRGQLSRCCTQGRIPPQIDSAAQLLRSWEAWFDDCSSCDLAIYFRNSTWYGKVKARSASRIPCSSWALAIILIVPPPTPSSWSSIEVGSIFAATRVFRVTKTDSL